MAVGIHERRWLHVASSPPPPSTDGLHLLSLLTENNELETLLEMTLPCSEANHVAHTAHKPLSRALALQHACSWPLPCPSRSPAHPSSSFCVFSQSL